MVLTTDLELGRSHTTSQRIQSGSGTIFILLSGSSAAADGSNQLAIFVHRHPTLSREHPAAHPGDYSLYDRGVRLQGSTGPVEAGRGRGLTLGHKGAYGDRPVHAAKCHEISANITHRDAELDTQFVGFR